MAKRKHLYPGTYEAEKERKKAQRKPTTYNDEPDWTPSGAPNYEKFEKWGWSEEKILVYLNID